MLSARYVAKKWIDEIIKSRVLNEASLQSVTACTATEFNGTIFCG